jgi:hypothetical protein
MMARPWRSPRALLLAGLLTLAACRDAARHDEDDPGADDASEGGSTAGDDASTPDDPPPEIELVGRGGLRRLSVYEYDNVVRDLLRDESRPARTFMPEDPRTPFDNDATEQVPSSALVDGVEALALDVARRLVQDAERRVAVVGCEPSGPEDLACLRPFVERAGRLALRRPLAPEEVDALLGLRTVGVEAGDAWVTVETIVAALLQHPELVYRVELGTEREDLPGVFRLGPYEQVSRLSFFLWGTTPDASLLDAAAELDAEGRSFTAEERRALAEEMLADPRALDQLDRFHALWLHYDVLPHEPELAAAMREETRALIERVIFDERGAFAELWRADETFVDAELAAHYGLPAPADPAGGWVSYAGSDRAGLLSHGSFLANGGAFGDTSPTMRGLVIKTRLLCQELPPPPPEVNADDQPQGDGTCKWDRFAVYRQPECIGCHGQMDPYGWGLEGYDAQGRARTVDDAGCELAPHTEVEAELGTFRGPGELGRLVAESEQLRSCVTTQLQRFALGRRLGEEDLALVQALTTELDPEFSLHDLVLDLVHDDAFAHRKEEQTP